MEISINDLDIDGYEIQKLGYQGKEIGEIKNKLLDLVLEEKLENKKRYLLDYILKNKLLWYNVKNLKIIFLEWL